MDRADSRYVSTAGFILHEVVQNVTSTKGCAYELKGHTGCSLLHICCRRLDYCCRYGAARW